MVLCEETDNQIESANDTTEDGERIYALGDYCSVSIHETAICENVGKISKIDNLERCKKLKVIIPV